MPTTAAQLHLLSDVPDSDSGYLLAASGTLPTLVRLSQTARITTYKKRTMTEAGRARIALAQRKRWHAFRLLADR